jgi:hypothetical protein
MLPKLFEKWHGLSRTVDAALQACLAHNPHAHCVAGHAIFQIKIKP